MTQDIPDSLTAAELARYDRQILVGEVGRAGQAKLKKARVLVVGAGGLGSAAALYLAAAGVGTLGIVDPDRVELANLNRQILHGTASVGRGKILSAKDRLADLNPFVKVEPLDIRLTGANAREVVAGFDLALGCVDNFAARYALNAACVRQGKPNVFGAAARLEGQAGVFCLPGGPCYRCFFREPPSDKVQPPGEKAVLGVAPGIIGCIMAAEAIKIILGVGRPLGGRLLLADFLAMSFREIQVKKDPACPVCGERKLA